MMLLITGAWQNATEYIPIIEALGHSVSFQQQEVDALPCPPEWVTGVVCNNLFLYHPIESFRNLRYIQLTSAGTDRVPLEYIRKHQISLHNAAGVYSIPMAEFAISGVLQIYKQSLFFYENREKHLWQKNRGLQELYGKNVCIIGCGSVGMECAKRFKAFGCHVIGINRTLRSLQQFDSIVSLDYLNEILPLADIVILSVSLTAETENLINAERIRLLKKSCVIVNLARGALLDESALENTFAVLDVFREEPVPPDSPLWEKKNILITPHNSFMGDGNSARLTNLILENLKSL